MEKRIKEELNELKSELQKQFFNLGIMLKKVKDEKLYLEKFKTFDEFLQNKFPQISSKDAQDLINMVSTGKIEEEYINKNIQDTIYAIKNTSICEKNETFFTRLVAASRKQEKDIQKFKPIDFSDKTTKFHKRKLNDIIGGLDNF